MEPRRTVLALALALTVTLALTSWAGAAAARSRTPFDFRVNLATGTVLNLDPNAVPRGQLAPTLPPCTEVVPAARAHASTLVVDTAPGAGGPVSIALTGDARNQLAWSWRAPTVTVAALALLDPRAPELDPRGRLVAVDPLLRTVRWMRDFSAPPPRCFVSAADEIVLAAERQTELVDPRSGSARWSVAHSTWVQSVLPLGAGTWLVHTDAELLAVERATGAVRWRAPSVRAQVPWVLAGRVVQLDAPPHGSLREAEPYPVRLRTYDAATGAARAIPLTIQRAFYDSVTMVAVPHAGADVDVGITFVVLD